MICLDMYGYVWKRMIDDMLIYSCIYIHIIVCYVNKDPTHLQGLDLGSDITSAVDYQVPSEIGVESVDLDCALGSSRIRWHLGQLIFGHLISI